MRNLTSAQIQIQTESRSHFFYGGGKIIVYYFTYFIAVFPCFIALFTLLSLVQFGGNNFH